GPWHGSRRPRTRWRVGRRVRSRPPPVVRAPAEWQCRGSSRRLVDRLLDELGWLRWSGLILAAQPRGRPPQPLTLEQCGGTT
ncbi:hypothetical protein, partial [Intrasporangium chromatireducens]|uniref:hypothetical protein n=1 Tax=Intrasporangium chromatireducens TaxID=1386088 RepID=UPI0005577869